jgi:Na+:H+ antiporter, NhaA family
VTRQLPLRQQQNPRTFSPLRDFLRTEAAGGILLAIGAVSALIWANSPWASSYESFWTTPVSLSFGNHALHLLLRQWINEGLITIFFFVVGLEIKRELVSGQLATKRAALLPIVAAVGGMAAPAMIYLAFAGRSAPRGWAIVIATDIPLALGVMAIVGSRVPSRLRVFLLALAIVDDIGALLVIAAFYSRGVGWGWLTMAFGIVVVVIGARRLGVQQHWFYIALGCLLWLMLHQAGLNATLAGVAMALLAPTTPRIAPELIDIEALADVSSAESVVMTTNMARGSISVVEWLEHVLHPWASYVIVPVFALANTGLTFSNALLHSAVRSPITWAIVAARVIGKPMGIMIATNVAIGSGLAERPSEGNSRQLLGVATSAGMGFTVALFVSDLAFTNHEQRLDATLGILVAAVTAAGLSLTILTTADKARRRSELQQVDAPE